MSCLMMKLEPLAALANAVEACLNCGYEFWGFDVPDSLPRALKDCQAGGLYSAEDIFRRLYALNARAYNSRYKERETPADERAPIFDGSRYVIHHRPEFQGRDKGVTYAVCPWHYHLARILDFWLYQTLEEAARDDPLRLAMNDFKLHLYSFIIQHDPQYLTGRWGDLPIPGAAPSGCAAPEETDPNRLLWDKLKAHAGHDVSIVAYAYPDTPADVCLECEDCGCVILDAETHTVCARGDLECRDRLYFEICIGPGPQEREDDFWMCVCGVREPSISEAEQFYAEDVSRNGGHVLSIIPIDEAAARNCYDFSNEDRWPVFGQ